MKNLNKYIVILIVLLLNIQSFSQEDPELPALNKPMKVEPINSVFKPKLDSVSHDLTNGLIDDISLYHSSGVNRAGSGDSIRLIYFLHGIGGDQGSWNKVYKAHQSKYRYAAHKPEYFGNQGSFDNATYATHNEMTIEFNSYKSSYPSRFDTIARPYVIAHSLGGLVSRDMDMKHDPLDLHDPLLNPVNRRFWGLVTFGTPHGGASIAGNQHLLASLGGTFSAKMLSATGNSSLAHVTSNSWVFNLIANKANLPKNLNDLATIIGETVVTEIINSVSQKNDGISYQFTPEATYLKDTLNQYSNPTLAKALFYGIEEDPILWRVAQFMVKPVTDYPTYGANDDNGYADMVSDLINKMEAKSTMYRQSANWHLGRARRWLGFWRGIGFFKYKSHMSRYGILNYTANATRDAASYGRTMNLKYKVIIGAVDESNLYVTDTAGYICTKTEQNTYYDNNGNVTPGYPFVYSYTTTSSCPNDTSYTISNIYSTLTTQVDITYTSKPQIRKILIETPSDATVLAPSAQAFPGCNIQFKNFMGPVQLDDGTWSKGKVNHLQMRNCYETKDALNEVYKGNGTTVPRFFKVHEW